MKNNLKDLIKLTLILRNWVVSDHGGNDYWDAKLNKVLIDNGCSDTIVVGEKMSAVIDGDIVDGDDNV